MRPGYAEDLNNIAAGHQALHEWDEAIAAARDAIRLRPDFSLPGTIELGPGSSGS